MSQTYFVKGLIGKVIAYGGLQIHTSLPHGLQPTNERRAESKLAYAMPSKEEEDDSQIPADINIPADIKYPLRTKTKDDYLCKKRTSKTLPYK